MVTYYDLFVHSRPKQRKCEYQISVREQASHLVAYFSEGDHLENQNLSSTKAKATAERIPCCALKE